ncbi:PRC-barrel domain-containing protein [Herbivorax sp. ANBcel31]|uniref:PRC-barrel domain-containing protein n=1 Tax=Herbivorax sp. ANBcel31 TaxID=3069754 RepID=UPI0027B6B0DD|nr:PRC-barrel domain-containing protein [Herbivorax sp. ANBcel31]MDQ2087423.1 PRC-barrel domain-containing protein [Herbivorax sp. ANBcel31]
MLLRSLKEMIGYKISAKDGEIGKVNDFYFDDRKWVVRYLVDKTGFWLFGRQILISPSSFEKPNWSGEQFHVSLTIEQVENSPPIDSQKPVSRENEDKIAKYYSWPNYWNGLGVPLGTAYAPPSQQPLIFKETNRNISQDNELKDEGLRSTVEVTGYEVSTIDGNLGYVEDFIVDDESWLIRYMVLDTKKNLDGKKVLIAPEWINFISWNQKKFSVNIPKESIQKCPDFDVSLPISREYEELLYNHYGCEKYWE